MELLVLLYRINLICFFDFTSSHLYLKPSNNFSKAQNYVKSGGVSGAIGPELDRYPLIMVPDGQKSTHQSGIRFTLNRRASFQ